MPTEVHTVYLKLQLKCIFSAKREQCCFSNITTISETQIRSGPHSAPKVAPLSVKACCTACPFWQESFSLEESSRNVGDFVELLFQGYDMDFYPTFSKAPTKPIQSNKQGDFGQNWWRSWCFTSNRLHVECLLDFLYKPRVYSIDSSKMIDDGLELELLIPKTLSANLYDNCISLFIDLVSAFKLVLK